ncbi:alpha/beta hydrolase-fold protein [Spirillospora sp. NPDC047279]|uniref:alpha/beta hydrolase n=1 Tax=Spirillospora sp. NPDC047279 TaxID=3155478 RepID=UPI0033F817A5
MDKRVVKPRVVKKRVSKKRLNKKLTTDRKIAIGGVAATAVLLPGVMVALAQTGIGRTEERPQASSSELPAPGPTFSFQPGNESLPTAPPTSPGKRPPSRPFTTGGTTPAPNDPDLRTGDHGKKPTMPKAKGLAGFKAADSGAKVTKMQKVGTRLYDLTIAAPSLGSEVKTRVLFPKAWKANATRTWPVVYAFHGGNNRYTSWIKDSNLQQVAAGYDVMVVMPEGGWNGSYTNWWNDGKGGIPMWETFHTGEVVQLMERNLHAGGNRAAIGLSSGGQGAITYAERHPGLFKYAASYSGALNITAPGMPTILSQMNQSAGDDIWGDPVRDRSNWRAHDGAVNVAKLKGVGVYVSSGNGEIGPYDPAGMEPWHAGRFGEQLAGQMNAGFVEAARQAGVPVTAHLYGPGTHKWAYWKRELVQSWPAITASIGATKS